MCNFSDNKEHYTKDDTSYEEVEYNTFAYLSDDNTNLNLEIPNGYLFFRYFNLDTINNNLKNSPIKINDIGLEQIGDDSFDLYLGADLLNIIRIPLRLRYDYRVSDIDTKAKLTELKVCPFISVSRNTLDKVNEQLSKDLDIKANYLFVYKEMPIYSVFIKEIKDCNDYLYIEYSLKDAAHHYVVDTHFENDLKSYKDAHPELVNPGPEPTFEKYYKELVEYYNNY